MTEHGEQTTVTSRIRDWADAHRDDLPKHLLELIAIETPSAEPATFPAFFDHLAREFEALGLETSRHQGTETGGWIEASTAMDADEIQLILGHADTVWPLGTVEERPPDADDEIVQGPGALDMKGGLTQLLFSLQALDELSLDPALPIHVLVSSDEEIGSPESKPRIVELAKRANRVYVLEPGEGPTGKIKIARKAVGRFTVHIDGEAAHAGIEPEKGASAIEELGSLIHRLHALTDLDSGVTVNVGEVDAGLRSNVVAPSATASVDVRAPTDADAERIEAAIREIEAETPGTELRVVGGFDRPPMEPTPGNQRLWKRVKTAGRRLGLTLESTHTGGASDGNDASQHAPTIDGFGAVGDGAHQTYEYVDIDALADRVALLTTCLIDEPLPEHHATKQ